MADKKDEPAANQITVKASECPVTKVTVYKDRAEVCRELETTVKAGTNELRIQEFVPVDEDSIRVDGKGNATIAEVSFQSKYVTEDEATMTAKEKELTEQLKTLEEEKRDLDIEAQKTALKKQWTILDQFAAAASKHGQGDRPEEQKAFQLDEAYFKGMREFMQQYKDIGKQLEAERLDLEKRIEVIDKKIAAVNKNLAEVRGNRHRGHEKRECIVVLEAEKETKVWLAVSYVVMGASWLPTYDLRMFTDEGTLKIIYYGLIRQSSGEDWTDVKLFLSTAEPSIGGTIPTLPQTQLSVKKYRPVMKRKGFGITVGAARYASPPPPPPPAPPGAMAMSMAAPPPPPAPMAFAEAEVLPNLFDFSSSFYIGMLTLCTIVQSKAKPGMRAWMTIQCLL